MFGVVGKGEGIAVGGCKCGLTMGTLPGGAPLMAKGAQGMP